MKNNYIVYVHINKINGKIYVGYTGQKAITRWINGNGYRTQSYFYNAIKKYGWDNFEHEIIASNLTQKEATNFEILLIEKLNSNNSLYGYNLTKGGEGSSGLKITEESKLKMSIAKKGLYDGENNPMYGISPKDRMDKDTYNNWLIKHQNINLGESNPNSKKIICLNTGEVFKCIKLASEKYNIIASDITSCCGNKLMSAGKYPNTNEPMIWQYYSDYLLGYKKEYNNSRLTKVYCITTDEVFNTIKEASEKYNIPSSNITLCCQGKYKKAGKHPLTKEIMTWIYYATV